MPNIKLFPVANGESVSILNVSSVSRVLSDDVDVSKFVYYISMSNGETHKSLKFDTEAEADTNKTTLADRIELLT